MGNMFTAKLEVRFVKDAVYGTGYDKDKVVEQADARDLVNVEVTASSLEQLQTKLVAFVGLVEI